MGKSHKHCSILSNIYKIQWLTSYPNVIAMVTMRNPKNASSLRNPYLSSKRNVNVSAMVIITPAQRGILKNIKTIINLIHFPFNAFQGTHIHSFNLNQCRKKHIKLSGWGSAFIGSNVWLLFVSLKVVEKQIVNSSIRCCKGGINKPYLTAY